MDANERRETVLDVRPSDGSEASRRQRRRVVAEVGSAGRPANRPGGLR
jgi:hypothetical protein